MEVAIHVRRGIPWQEDYAKRLVRGFARHGVSVFETQSSNHEADVEVILGPHWPRSLENGDFIQVNRAFIGQSTWTPNDDHCVAIGWGGMNGKGDFCIPSTLDKDRWKKFHSEDDVWEYHKEGGVVICGQADNGRSDIQLDQWYKQMYTQFPVADYRPHPTDTSIRNHQWAFSQHALTLNSTVAVDAILNGNSVVSCDQGNPLYAFTPHEPLVFEYPDQEEILQVLSHCQFDCKEVEDGTFWEQLKGKRSGQLKDYKE